MRFVIAVLDFDEGLSFCGPVGSNGRDTREWAEFHAHVHCELVPLLWKDHWANTPASDDDEPHIIVTGNFATGYTCYGPFVSLEAAEQVSGSLPEYAYIMPLEAAHFTESQSSDAPITRDMVRQLI